MALHDMDVDKEGRNSLHRAVIAGNQAEVKRIPKEGIVDKNAPDKHGKTPADYARGNSMYITVIAGGCQTSFRLGMDLERRLNPGASRMAVGRIVAEIKQWPRLREGLRAVPGEAKPRQRGLNQ